MLTCKQVAQYFLALSDEDAGDTISNLKLQKLVYYAQGVNLAIHGKPLFREKIEAWAHGPVVPELYHEYKQCGSGTISTPMDMDFKVYSKTDKEVLDEVYKVFGQFSAWKLRNLTHAEPPWRDTPVGSVISHGVMKDYFKTLITDD